MSFLLGTFLQSFQRSAFTILIRFRDILYKLVIVLLTSTVIVWLSVFLYGTFYYTYMPAVSHIKPVHLQFRWCDNLNICDFPSANVTLIKKGQEQLLMRGQRYKVYLDLEMPESPANQQLGMFMVRIDFVSRIGQTLHSSSRSVTELFFTSAMLRYKSPLHQTLSTLFFTPLLLLGSAEEKQMLSLELCDFYEEDPGHPAVTANVEIQNKRIEIYSAQLRIYAHFTGLRYLMFHWPVLSAIVGIGTNLFFLSVVALLSWYRYLVSHESHEVVVRVGFDDSRVTSIDKRRTQVKEFLMREKQRQSRLKASFSAYDVTNAGQSRAQLQQHDPAVRTRSLDMFPLAVTKEEEDPLSSLGITVSEESTPRRPRTLSDSGPSSHLQETDERDGVVGKEVKVVGNIETEVDSAEDMNSSFEQDSENDMLTMADVETGEGARVFKAGVTKEVFTSDYLMGPLRKRQFVQQFNQLDE